MANTYTKMKDFEEYYNNRGERQAKLDYKLGFDREATNANSINVVNDTFKSFKLPAVYKPLEIGNPISSPTIQDIDTNKQLTQKKSSNALVNRLTENVTQKPTGNYSEALNQPKNTIKNPQATNYYDTLNQNVFNPALDKMSDKFTNSKIGGQVVRPFVAGAVKNIADLGSIGETEEQRAINQKAYEEYRQGLGLVGKASELGGNIALNAGLAGAMPIANSSKVVNLTKGISNPILNTMAREGIENAAFGAITNLPTLKNEGLGEYAKNVALEGAGGALFGGAIEGAGQGIKKLKNINNPELNFNQEALDNFSKRSMKDNNVSMKINENLPDLDNIGKNVETLKVEVPKVEDNIEAPKVETPKIENMPVKTDLEPIKSEAITNTSNVEKPLVSPNNVVKMNDSEVATTTEKFIDENGIERPNSQIKFSDENTKKTSLREKASNLYTRIVDKNNPIKNVSDKAHIKATISTNADGVFSNILEKGLSDKEGKIVGKSFKELVKDIPEGNDFWEYMYQRHNIDRANVGNNVFKDFTSEQSSKAVKQWEELNPNWKDKADEIVNWYDTFMRKQGVESGLIGEDFYNQLKETYKSYIPSHRNFEDDELFNEISARGGFVDQKNNIKKATGSDRDITNPIESMLKMMDSTIKSAKRNEVFQQLYDDTLNGTLKKGGILEILDKPVSGKNNIVSGFINGKQAYLQVNDSMLLKSLEGAFNNADSDITRSARSAMNKFKSLITQYNPIFAFTNAFRDLQNYLILSKEGNIFKKVFALGDAYKDIFSKGGDYTEFTALGGQGGNYFNRDKSANIARDLLNGSKESKLSKLHPLRAIENFNNTVETAPRLAEYKMTKARTGDKQQALYDAMDVTTNFSRYGDVTKKVDAYQPFLNASVQGADKLIRSFKENPIKTTINGATVVTAPTLLLNAINKDNKNYQELDNRTKDNYYIIPDINNDGKFIKLPKSRDLGVIFGALTERIIRQANGEKNSFKGFGNTVTSNLSPVDGLNLGLAQPIVDLDRNKDFAGRTIVSQTLQGVDKKEQYDETTSELSKKLGKILNQSPKQIDYLIDSYTGVIGDILLPATTKGLNGGGKGAIDKVVTRKFTADPLYNSQITTDFYDNLNEINTKHSTNNLNNKRIGSDSKAPTLKLNSLMNSYSKEISDINKEIRQATTEQEVRRLKVKALEIMRKANTEYTKNNSVINK